MKKLEVKKDFTIENEKVLIFSAPDWLKGRENYIGGSESFAFGAELLNVNYKFNTPFTVWCNKSGFGIQKDSSYMQYGRDREPDIFKDAQGLHIDEYEEKVEVFQSPHTYVMRDYPFVGANLDGIVRLENGELAGLEIKTSSYAYGWTETRIPLYYWNQVQHYMLVTGLKEFFVIAEVCEKTLMYRIQADRDYQRRLLKKMVDFWAYVAFKKQPEIMYVNCEKPYTKKLDTQMVDIMNNPELEPYGAEYCLLRDKKLEIERRSKELVNIFKYAIKPGHKAKAGDYTFHYTIRSCRTLDTETFKKAEPSMYEKYLITKNREMLCVSEKGKS